MLLKRKCRRELYLGKVLKVGIFNIESPPWVGTVGTNSHLRLNSYWLPSCYCWQKITGRSSLCLFVLSFSNEI
jgi:hypothetical protein